MVRLTDAARDLRAEERRAQILRAALSVFGHKGFHGATIREIASAAGLAEGTIYLYFASKQDVLRGVFALIADEARDDSPRRTGHRRLVRDRQLRVRVLPHGPIDDAAAPGGPRRGPCAVHR